MARVSHFVRDVATVCGGLARRVDLRRAQRNRRRTAGFVQPNVRAKLAPTVWRQGQVGENVQRTADLALVTLSEGLGLSVATAHQLLSSTMARIDQLQKLIDRLEYFGSLDFAPILCFWGLGL